MRVGGVPLPGGVRRRAAGLIAVAVAATLALPTTVAAETLREALAAAYGYNPRLDAERARLRATDEEVPRARAGYLPTISGQADMGRSEVATNPRFAGDGAANPWGYSINVSQPLFRGFRTINGVAEAEAGVRAGREGLRNVEQAVLFETVTAYADIVRDMAIVRIRENNVRVMTYELAAAEARRKVREVTRTDVAQTEARRAKAISALDTAKGNLRSSRAAFEKVVGHAAAGLAEPWLPTEFLPRTLEEATQIAAESSPIVIAALYREQGARHAVDRVRGDLLPEVRLEASYNTRHDTSATVSGQDSASIVGRVNVPFYNGGETHARVRQAKHTHVGRLQEIEQARAEATAAVTQGWARLMATRAGLKSDRVQVEASRLALEGVRAEQKVGQRTILDVLNAEQELLDAQVQLTTTRRDHVVASHGLLQSIGRLDVETLKLADAAYDADAHYEEVRRKWFGISITRADGRIHEVDAADAQSEPEARE